MGERKGVRRRDDVVRDRSDGDTDLEIDTRRRVFRVWRGWQGVGAGCRAGTEAVAAVRVSRLLRSGAVMCIRGGVCGIVGTRRLMGGSRSCRNDIVNGAIVNTGRFPEHNEGSRNRDQRGDQP